MIRTRLNELRKKLLYLNLDAIIIENKSNRYYLSGFTGSFGFILVTQNDAILFTSKFEVEDAINEVKELQIVCTGRDFKEIFSFINNSKIKSIIIEDHLTLANYNYFRFSLGDIELIIKSGFIEEMRQKKDQSELNDIRYACKITDEVFLHLLDIIKTDIKEIDVAIELESYLLKRHNLRPAFDIVVASGIRGALPHGHATEKLIKQGELVTIDFGVLYKGYMSDMTRTIAMGEPNEEMEKIYNIVLEAQQTSIKHLKPGVSVSEIDQVGREIISQAGYDAYTHTASGHGIGLNLHEPPIITSSNRNRLNPRNVITIEPGINIPGVGGVRIEDTVLVHESGYEIFTKSTKELITLPIK